MSSEEDLKAEYDYMVDVVTREMESLKTDPDFESHYCDTNISREMLNDLRKCVKDDGYELFIKNIDAPYPFRVQVVKREWYDDYIKNLKLLSPPYDKRVVDIIYWEEVVIDVGYLMKKTDH